MTKSFPDIEAGEFILRRGGSVNPAKFPDEVFELHSIPAFDAGKPDITAGCEIGSNKQLVQPNDVMLSKIVPHIRRASVVGSKGAHRQIASGEWIVFRDSRFFPGYLRHLLISDWFNARFMQTVSGVGGSLLRARPAEVAKIKIPLPPLPEQRRIAAILDKADALRAKRRAAIAKLDQLLQSVFLDMFGDPVTNPKGWPVKPLPTLAEKFCDGPFGSNLKSSHYRSSGVRVVRLQNIGVWRFSTEDAAFISEDHFESLPRNHCEPGDVLIGTLGNPNLRACLLPEKIDRALNKADCILFRANPELANAEYICGLMNCESLVNSARGLALGQTRLRISMGRLKSLHIPVPPVREQEKFSIRVNEIGHLRSQITTGGRNLDALFSSLQQRAFSGQL